MTNKIIIDGVDVSECDHYTDGECYFNYFDGISEGRCTDFKNCDHKQLQRKTAECKNNEIAYKNELEIYNKECLNLTQELEERTAECEELKAKLDEYANSINKGDRIINQIMNMRLEQHDNIIDDLKQQLKYKTKDCEELKEELAQEKLRNNDCFEQFKELRNKLQIATEALDIIANQNFNTPNKICNLAEKELVPCTNSCKYCLQAYAKRALKQIESEEQ